MPRKLLMFGGVIATSVATLTPGGILLQKAIRTKQMKEERMIFISKAEKVADKWNKSKRVLFLKDWDEDDKWKLIWIWDVFKYYQKNKKQPSESLKYSREEMEKAEGIYWKEAVMDKKEKKWLE